MIQATSMIVHLLFKSMQYISLKHQHPHLLYHMSSASTQPPQLLTLPPELLLLISSHLPYPDALSLKHTSPYLYHLVPTTVRLRVSWLVDRRNRGLVVPRRKCVLKTDASFCCSGEVRSIMEIRRSHGECKRDGAGQCEVLVGRRCDGVPTLRMVKGRRLRGFMKGRLPADETSLVILSILIFCLAVVLLYTKGIMQGETCYLAQLVSRTFSA